VIKTVETGMAAAPTFSDRTTYIGGSDVACIVGAQGAYQTAAEVWQEKISPSPRRESNEMMFWGNVLESLILKTAEKRLKKLRRLPVLINQKVGSTFRHPKYPFLAASADMVLDEGKVGTCLTIVDAKNTQKYDLAGDGEIVEDIECGLIPAQWVYQLHHYAYVLRAATGRIVSTCLIAALVKGNQLRLVEVTLDLNWYAEKIVPKLIEFWWHVENKVKPEPQEPADVLAPVELNHMAATAQKYKELGDTIKAITTEREALRVALLEAVKAAGGPSKAMAGDYPLSYYLTERSELSKEGVEAEAPGILARHTSKGNKTENLRVNAPKRPKAV